MVLNKSKYMYIVNTLAKNGWGYYRQDNSTVIYWVDPNYTHDYRTKDAYIKMRERQGWDGQDTQRQNQD